MEFLIDLGVFSGKVLVLTLAIAALFILVAILIIRARQTKAALSVEHLNQKFDDMANALKAVVMDEKAYKQEAKSRKKQEKAKGAARESQKRIYVVDFNGDIRASHVENLREEITAVLTVARPGLDEVLVRVESPGGMVHAYGLAAAQLLRVRTAGLRLNVAIDKMAASGGYMMACTADHIMASPFAVVGSIGVIAQVPNFHRLLKKHDVDYEELTAGEFKRTVSVLGEITDKGRQKFLEQIEDTHGLFKDFVHQFRPRLDLSKVATGEYWYGQRALALNLIDEVVASDEFLFRNREAAQIYKVESQLHKKWADKIVENLAGAVLRATDRAWSRATEARF